MKPKRNEKLPSNPEIEDLIEPYVSTFHGWWGSYPIILRGFLTYVRSQGYKITVAR